MEPKFIEKGSFKVAGLQTYGNAMDSLFAKMWEILMSEDGPNIPGKIHPEPTFGICSYTGSPSEKCGLFYMAAYEVDSLDSIPPNAVGKVIPANTYAVFRHHGVLDESLKETFSQAFQWLESSTEYSHAGPYDLEYYGPEFKGPHNPDSILEIWVPVKKKG